jgi:hypothetical protein
VQFKGIINAKQGPNTVKRKEKKKRVHQYFPTHGKVTILKVIDYRSVKKRRRAHRYMLPSSSSSSSFYFFISRVQTDVSFFSQNPS